MTLPRSSRLVRALTVSACLAVAALTGAQASPAATRQCAAPDYPDVTNGGYFTSIRATNVTCKSARKLVLAYYKCRRHKGIKGSCSGRTVNELTCRETRRAIDDNGTQYNATVTCRKGTKKVVHKYQQNYAE